MIRSTIGWWRERPGWREWVFLPTIALMGLASLGPYLPGGPAWSWLDAYYANPGILALIVGATALDAACAMTIIVWMIIPRRRAGCLALLLRAAFVGPVLIRAEHLYEKAIYYGEVRDKWTSLPCDLNNLGPIGSEIFVAYFLLRIPLGEANTLGRLLIQALIRVALLIASHVGHQLLYWPGRAVTLSQWHWCY